VASKTGPKRVVQDDLGDVTEGDRIAGIVRDEFLHDSDAGPMDNRLLLDLVAHAQPVKKTSDKLAAGRRVVDDLVRLQQRPDEPLGRSQIRFARSLADSDADRDLPDLPNRFRNDVALSCEILDFRKLDDDQVGIAFAGQNPLLDRGALQELDRMGMTALLAEGLRSLAQPSLRRVRGQNAYRACLARLIPTG
jgi:hypothetical protein